MKKIKLLIVLLCAFFITFSIYAEASAQSNAGSEAGIVVQTTTGSPRLGGEASGSGQGSGISLGGRCNQSNPFFLIACKATTTLADLRVIVYVLAGFGLIMFTFGAIFGKISWKHFSQIAIGLFIISMMGQFIQYFTGKSNYTTLQFGKYLPDGNHAQYYVGSFNSIDREDCGDNCLEDVGDVELDAASVEETKNAIDEMLAGFDGEGTTGGGAGGDADGGGDKLTLQDLKDGFNSAKNIINRGRGTVATINNAANAIKRNTDRIINSIRSGSSIAGKINSITGSLSDISSNIKGAGSIVDGNFNSIQGSLNALGNLGGGKSGSSGGAGGSAGSVTSTTTTPSSGGVTPVKSGRR